MAELTLMRKYDGQYNFIEFSTTGVIHVVDNRDADFTLCERIIESADKQTADRIETPIPRGKVCLACLMEAMRQVLRRKQPFYRNLLLHLITYTTKD